MSWILLIFVVNTVSATTAMSAVPGYATEAECKVAQLEMAKRSDQYVEGVRAICVPGPKK